MHPLITDTASLAALCETLAAEPFITIDTEFMREKTYYPELCLVQIAGAGGAGAVDPLAPGIDLAPLYALLENPDVLKVFHACRQDMEIFYQRMGKVPAPIFDTQIAALVLGFGESIGYEGLVGKVLGLPVDKSSRFTDWSKRPLTEKQLTYAMDDVLHLREVYIELAERLEKEGRLRWIDEEMEPLLAPATYDTDPDEVWRKIRLRQNSPRYLAYLQAAARWRELTARERNVPRGRIMKDETLAEVAQSKPAGFTELQAIRGFYPTMSSSLYEPLFAALRAVDALPSSAYPRLPKRLPPPEGAETISDLLRLLLKAAAERHHVVARLIADKDDLEALAAGTRDGVPALSGWRYAIFGMHAIQLLEGRITLRVDPATRQMEFVHEENPAAATQQ